MQKADVIIIGGGPAGSTCAGKLRAGGLDVLIVDKAEFPRSKLCSGWITPGVVDDLKLDVEEYCQGRVFQPMSGFCIGRIGGASVQGRLRPNGQLRHPPPPVRRLSPAALRGPARVGRSGEVDRAHGRRLDRQRAVPGPDAGGGRRPFLPRRAAAGQSRRARPGDLGPGDGNRTPPRPGGRLPRGTDNRRNSTSATTCWATAGVSAKAITSTSGWAASIRSSFRNACMTSTHG